jgi:hypothetical protein
MGFDWRKPAQHRKDVSNWKKQPTGGQKVSTTDTSQLIRTSSDAGRKWINSIYPNLDKKGETNEA